jgi:hypothetical protein
MGYRFRLYDLSFRFKGKDCGVMDDVEPTPIVNVEPMATVNF